MTIRTAAAALLGLAALVALGAAPAHAQPYPAKPIRWVVGFPAGSSIDVTSRLVAEEIRRKSGASIVVENRPGAIGTIATDQVAKSPPDGYTVMASSSATHSSGPRLVKSVAYDAIRDFTPLGLFMRFDLLLVVNAAGPHRTVAGLVDAGRRNPGKLNFGYGSATGQVAAISFSRAAGIQTQGVSYKGQPQALADLMGGQLDFVLVDVAAALSLVRSGKLAALGITSERRSTIVADVPTLAEAGVRGVELTGWVGVSGPAGLPADVVAWWSAQLVDALAQPELGERMRAMGVEAVADRIVGDTFVRYVAAQFDVWGRHIEAAGIKPE